MYDKEDLKEGFISVTSNDPISAPFPPKELNDIDFSNEIGILLSLGLKSNSPHLLSISKIIEKENELIVAVEVTPPGDVAADALDFRITLLKLDRSDVSKSVDNVLIKTNSGEILSELPLNQSK